MIDVLFVLFLVLYFWVSYKIENWLSISMLGFNTETPLYFPTKTGYYTKARAIIFLIPFALSFFTIYLPTGLCLILLAFNWFYSGVVGRKIAFDMYREIMIDLANHEDDINKRNEYLEYSRRSNRELQDDISKRLKMGY